MIRGFVKLFVIDIIWNLTKSRGGSFSNGQIVNPFVTNKAKNRVLLSNIFVTEHDSKRGDLFSDTGFMLLNFLLCSSYAD